MDDCDQITINIIPDQSVDINAITLNQGIINHSVTHQSGGSDELLHNLLGGLQGGSGNGYYHLSSGQYFNLTTGEVVRPSETGIFYTNNNPSGFITGVDLSSYATIVYTTGISGDLQDQIIILNNQTGTYITGSVVRPNETGIFITNSQTGQFYANSNPSGFITGIDLSAYSTITYVTGVSGNLQNQINILNNQTGSYVLNTETGNFITTEETGIFYPRSNPSGFITGIDLSSYATIQFTNDISGELQTQITTLDNQTGSYYPRNNPSGYITGVDLSFSGNYYTKDESESRYVNTTGTETILGDKTFHDKVYINNLYVTGLETIVNTTNTNVASNYIMLNLTGGAVDGGIFFVTGSGLTGINDSGAIIGFDHSDKFKFGIGTRADDLSTLNTIASEQQLTGASGYLQTQIITLNNQTGDYALNINTGNFITSSQTGQFYASSNPSGFITGVDLSAYVLNSETGNFITNSQTGEFYSNSNPSGFITGINNLVYTTGDQIISGSKTFDFRPNVNGTGILLSGEAAQLPETIIYSTGDQNISGIKTFNDLPNIPITPISGNNPTSKEYVDTLISGVNLSIQDYLVSISTNSLSSFTLGSGDNNKVIQCTSTTGITVTLPNSLPQGFNCVLIQSNSGQINIQGESGVAVGSFGNLVKTAGQHAPVSIICLASGIYNIAGNLI